MKTSIIKSALAIFTVVVMLSCGKKQEVKEKYCGLEMSGFEVMDAKMIGNKGYEYTAEDKDLLVDITEQVHKLFNDELEIEFFFFMKDKDKIGMYIIAPDDKEAVEVISCYLLKNDFEGRLPSNKNLIFYTDKHETLVAAIKNKE
ncbi:hypothetical protein D3C87_256160 [compost metagenome]